MLPPLQTRKTIRQDQGESKLRETSNREFLVSVVCVTLNAAKNLPFLIKSVRDHKTDLIEFVIVDGKSNDGTLDLLKENEDVIDFWISKPDEGIYDAMNRALNYIRGKWVIFLGADDLLLEGFEKAVDKLEDPLTIYYGNVLWHGKPFSKIYDDYYLTKLNICHQIIFYPRAVFMQYNFNLQYPVYADYHLNLRCWNDRRFKFAHINHFISYFHHGGFSSYTKDPAFETDRNMLFRKYLKMSSYYRYLNRTLGFFGMFMRFIQNR
jgi:glycosyltransferase involved in cell wall biosynthesis